MQRHPHIFTRNKRVFESLPDFAKSLQMVKIVTELPSKVDQRLPLGNELAKMCYNNTPARHIINKVKEEHAKNPKLLYDIMNSDFLSLILNF